MQEDTPLDALSFQDDLSFPDAGLDATFYPTSAVLEVLRDSDSSAESRTLAAAELLARHFFLEDGNESIRKALEGALGGSVLARFDRTLRNFKDNADDVKPDDILRTLRGTDGERVLCDRLRPVLDAHGFIPLVLHGIADRPACLLPFSFERCPPGCDGETVLDRRGRKHEVWTNLLRERLPGCFVRHGNPHCIRLAFVRDGRFESMPVDGESLLLPVLVAWNRFCGKLPRYGIFRLFATGEISPDGGLGRVETQAKWDLVRTIPGARLLAPDTGRPESQDPSGVLPEGTNIRDGLPAPIVEKVEAWFVSDWKYAVARLADQGLVSEINHGHYGGWNRMIDRLKNLGEPLSSDDIKERLLTEMWLGQACCHATRTDEAMEHNRTAHRLASEVPGFRYELQRLDVEMIVNLTDKEAFDDVLALSGSLETELREENWKENEAQQTDLAMRWHGSLGQALAYGALDGRPGFSKEAAKAAFEAALSDARRRKEIVAGDNPDADTAGLDADIVQDANYVHLWHALFDPSSEEAVEAYAEAKKLRRRLDALSPARRTNEVYQLRQLALAAYRRLLSGEAADAVAEETFRLESENSFFVLVDDSDAEPWLRATVAKYMGALAAARDDSETAKELFGKAVSFIGDGAVARKIAMTVRAEAFRSLRGRFPDVSSRYREEAKGLLVDIPDRWRVWLENPDTAPFPALSYWY